MLDAIKNIQGIKERPPSLYHRLFGKLSAANAYARSYNATISGDLSSSTHSEIDRRYTGNVALEFKTLWVDLLEQIVFHCAADGAVDDNERDFLTRYAKLYQIERTRADAAVKTGLRKAFVHFATGVLIDGDISEANLDKLQEISIRLGLDGSTSEQGIRDATEQILEHFFDEAIQDGLITDLEWDRLHSLADKLGLSAFPHSKQRALSLAHERWRIWNGQFSPVETDEIRLQSGERVHFIADAVWYETRKVRSGGESRDVLQPIANGRCYLTNKRILLYSQSGDSKSARWQSGLSVQGLAGEHGFKFSRSRGKSPVILFTGNPSTHIGLGAEIACSLFQNY